MNTKRLFKLIIFIILLVLAVSCAGNKKPEQRPSSKTTQPKIPESISRGQGKEPVLKVYIEETKNIEELPFEEYVQGVVAGEMKNDWPEEALAAQAILARTFVMEFVTEKGGSRYKGAHISTDIEEAQAWDREGINERIKNAVKKTRGEVALHNNKYIKAWFHAHGGGKTATAGEGLAFKGGEPSYIQVTESPDSPEAPEDNKSWTASFSTEEVLKALGDMGRKMNGVSSVKVLKKGPSGRAMTLGFDGIKVPAPEFRVAIGSTKMKSTLIDNIETKGDTITIKGRGYGHGVGMSQWGAYAMAKEGKKAEDIVKHYFKGVEIVKAWD